MPQAVIIPAPARVTGVVMRNKRTGARVIIATDDLTGQPTAPAAAIQAHTMDTKGADTMTNHELLSKALEACTVTDLTALSAMPGFKEAEQALDELNALLAVSPERIKASRVSDAAGDVAAFYQTFGINYGARLGARLMLALLTDSAS